MSKIKGILFDKDGTLIDFHSIWVPIASKLAELCILELKTAPKESTKIENALLEAIGVVNEGVIPEGILASGTTQDISKAFLNVFDNFQIPIAKREHFTEWVKQTIFQLTHENVDQIKPIKGIKAFLEALVNKGLIIGIATADDLETTKLCLEKLEIDSYFDFIATSDYYEKKPNPAMLRGFCQKYDLSSNEVVMVGDTHVDLAMAKNGAAGLAVGVLSGTGSLQTLRPLADFVLSSATQIISDNGLFYWENQLVSPIEK